MAHNTEQASLADLINEGIVIEDAYIDLHTRELCVDEFLGVFGENRQQAEQLLMTLHDESVRHKKDLEGIINELINA